MSIPSAYAPIKSSDFTIKPVIVNKRFSLKNSDLATTGSGYQLVEGLYTSLKTPIGSSKAWNDPTNSLDGSYKHVIWKSIDHLYYKRPYNRFETFEHANRRYTYKFLNTTASILAMPYMDVGEKIKPNSIEYTGSTYKLKDDGNGNIYDSEINTGSFTLRHALLGYWGFNDIFRKFKYNNGIIEKGKISYISHIFEPDVECGVKNVNFELGVPIANTGSGMCATFNSNGFIYTHNKPELNFATYEDFTISAWIKVPPSQSNYDSDTNSIISKRGAIYKQTYGRSPKYNSSGELQETTYVSQSLQNEPTNVFSYAIELYNTGSNARKIKFSRSDGANEITLIGTAVLPENDFTHICVTKSGSLITLYENGVSVNSTEDSTINPMNDHLLFFGAENLDFKKAFSGSIDEVRFYDYACTSETVLTLADNTNSSLYQTAVIGNVFYRKGNIIISPMDTRYHSIFNDTFTLNYRGTHTIYEYEALCRIKKGSHNCTMNHTARISHKSDLYINEMTGSTLSPYFTSIGLYNHRGDLVAIAKTGQPIKTRDDVDINILVKWDS